VFRINNYHTSIAIEEILGAFAKLRKGIISFVMSVRLSVYPHGITRLRLDGFS